MHARKLVFLSILFVGIFGLLRWSTRRAVADSVPPHDVYVSAPEDGKILKVDVNGDVEVILDSEDGPTDFAPTAMTFGPDGNLWVVTGIDIIKVPPTGGSFTLCHTFTGGLPGDIRFLADIPYITTEDGVFRLDDPEDCDGLAEVNDQGLEDPAGVFFEVAGRILFLDGGGGGGGKLYRSGPPFSLPELVLEELDELVAVGTRGSHGFPDTDDTYVSTNVEFGEIKGFDCSPSEDCEANGKTIEFGGPAVRDFEVNLAGNFLVATQSTSSEDCEDGLAKLWLVTFDEDQMPQLPDLLVDFCDFEGDEFISDIFGVAIPPTSNEVTQEFSGSGTQTRRYNCGNSLADLSFDPMGDEVEVTIDCTLELPGAVNDGFGGDAAGAFCAQYDTSNGFCTIYDVQSEIEEESLLVTYVRKAEPLAATPLVVRNSDEVTIVDYYLQGELDPEDQGRKSGRASEIVVADGPTIEDAAEFLGFKPVLGGSCQAPLIVKGNGGIPLEANFSEPCNNGDELRLSIVCNVGDPPFLSIDVTSRGNANFENFFRCTGNKWKYNLDPVGSGIPKNSCCAITAWGSLGATGQGFFKRQ
jgi:hypothetical protein